MTNDEWKKKLQDGINGKTGQDLIEAKREIFEAFAAGHPDEYAWENGNRRKPTGVSHIASKIHADMIAVFGELYDPTIGYQAATKMASYYY